MHRSNSAWFGGLSLFLVVLAGLALGLDKRVLSHWSYAVELGRIQANGEELARIEEVSNAFRMVSKLAGPGVVHIRVSGGDDDQRAIGDLREHLREQLGERFDEEQWERFLRDRREAPTGSGSGIVLDTDGFILTNNHVVGGRTSIVVRLPDEREYEAELIGTDPKTDLAVIKIKAPDLHPLKFGNSDLAEVGDWVLAVGAPFGLTQTVTHGIISAKGRSQVVGVPIYYQNFLQTDASINPGNSGGPLVNLRGEVIGVNTAIATNGDSYNAGIAFTIPSNMAARVADQLKKFREVRRGWLGISMGPLENADDLRLFGIDQPRAVIVEAILPNTPAQRAGLRVEDTILSVNQHRVTTTAAVIGLIGDMQPGQTARLGIVRNRQPIEVSVELARQPEEIERVPTPASSQAVQLDRLGLLVRSLRPSQTDRFGFKETTRGVQVLGVAGGRSEFPDDLKPLDVITEVDSTPITTAAELESLLQRQENAAQLRLNVTDSRGNSRTVTVRPRP